MSKGKKIAIAFGIVLIVGAGVYAYFLNHYSVDPEKFKSWHHSLDAGFQDASKRNLPLLVKVGAKF
jgi:hypothetical protein